MATAEPRYGKVWTDEELQQLRREWAENWTLEQMAAAHGRTPYAIIAKLQYFGHIVLIGNAYHRIDPDPWVLVDVVRAMQTQDANRA